MSDNSAIEWTDSSWNPIRARNLKTGKIGWYCEHKTTGCEFCYAEGMNKRLGTGLPFKPGHRKDVEIFLDEKTLIAPLKWKRPRMIFVCSMTDIFADFVTDAWIEIVFNVIAQAPQHKFQILTKRPERMLHFLTDPNRRFCHQLCDGMGCNYCGDYDGRVPWKGYELTNIWLGVSCETQTEADDRIPLLLQTPAHTHFISAEPLLGPIELWHVSDHAEFSYPGLDWVIVGGESGPQSRPMDIDWARSIVAQCREAGIYCFVKQLGSKPMLHGFKGIPLKHGKGGNPDEWPEDLRIREMPSETA
jgi:protein gp37